MNLAERASRARAIIGTLASEGRGPKMSVPVRDEDEDVFVCDTLYGLEAEVERLSADLDDCKRGLVRCWADNAQLSDDLAAARARIPNPNDLRYALNLAESVPGTPSSYETAMLTRLRATLPTTPEQEDDTLVESSLLNRSPLRPREERIASARERHARKEDDDA